MKALNDEIIASGGELLVAYIFFRTDETPMRMAVADVDGCLGLPPKTMAHLVGAPEMEEPAKVIGVRKLLQSEYHVALLVRTGDKLGVFSWSPMVPIQAIQRTRSQCYHQACCLRLSSLGIQVEIRRYRRRVYFNCVDREGGLAKGLRTLA